MSEEEFTKALLSDQPFIPAYFSYDVELNRKGAPAFKESIEAVKIGNAVKNEADAENLAKAVVIVDARKEKVYKQGHLLNSVNLMEGAKFETWLGSIIKPGEQFYLAGESKDQLQELIERAAAIGYEPQIKEAFVLKFGVQSEPVIDVDAFKENLEGYTIIDVRNGSELKEGKPFKNSLSMPLPEVRDRVNEIPRDKPIVVHCASGYRSAAGSSIIRSALDGKLKVFDLSDAIKQFQK
jgi:rhodanese-related sulfurtransferase